MEIYPPSSEGGSVEGPGAMIEEMVPDVYPPSSEGGSVEGSP